MAPPTEVIALNRLTFGPRPGDVEALARTGLDAWLDEQLAPDDAQDTLCTSRLQSATLRIAYEAGKDREVSWEKVEEDRPLGYLNKPLGEYWHLIDWSKPMPYEERVRPFHELRSATWIRAVYSKWQVRELLVDFWHNHFNVHADADAAIQVALPTYDREVIRKHCLGNFRQMLEEVAKSVAMLRYLNNGSSRASPANENYARELFELHTLGAEHYLNHLYNRWREVPGAVEGKPEGYIDQDVYEASRAFTGWTFGGGQWARNGEHLPQSGEFIYFEPWHDNYQKRVLGVEFDPNQPPMADGRKVLDLVAAHPGTARHVCRKLCRRLVADDPPQELVDVAVAAWTEHRDAPDQIAQTVRAIVRSTWFNQWWADKVKRPFEFVAALLRATEADFMPDPGFLWTVDQTNQRLFNWPTPTGHPDDKTFWLGASTMLKRWTIPLAVISGWFPTIRVRLLQDMPEDVITCRQVAEFWARRILGFMPEAETMRPLIEFTARGAAPDQPLPGSDPQLAERVTQLVALISMTPEFHLR